jgi:hypothetical protein
MVQAQYKILVNGKDLFTRTVEVSRRRTITVPVSLDVVVATLANDFSLTQSSMPWLWAATSPVAVTSGPPVPTPASPQSSWTLTAADEDGTTGTVTVQLVSGNDGTYRVDTGRTTTSTFAG